MILIISKEADYSTSQVIKWIISLGGEYERLGNQQIINSLFLSIGKEDNIEIKIDIFEKISMKIDNYFNSYQFKGSENIKFHIISVVRPGLKTVTAIKENEEVFKGLHVDRGANYSIGECNKSKQRLCLNLGETRYLYLFDITVNEFNEIYKEKTNKVLTFESLMKEYYNMYKNYPIKVIELPYGCYYIAPTDNLIHDASTLTHISTDLCIHYLGDFKLNLKNVYEQQ